MSTVTTARYASIDTAPAWVAACLDTCEKCGTRDIRPGLWAIRRTTLVCAYRCPTCGHGWWNGSEMAAVAPAAEVVAG